MMKVKIIIEEVITQKFEVEIDEEKGSYDQIRNLYKKGDLVVENPTLINASFAFDYEDEMPDFVDLHV